MVKLSQSLSSVRLSQGVTTLIVTMTILLICGSRQVQGGCSRFGHSCFGAHGKRGDLPTSYEMNQANFDSPPNPGYMPLPNGNNGRMSPYLIDWILSAHRGDLKPMIEQQHGKDDGSQQQPMEMRRK